MHSRPEPLLDQVRQRGRPQRGVGGQQRLEVVDDLAGEFAWTLRAWLAGNQGGGSALGEGGGGLVVGLAGEPERRRRGGP
jgi:hypothetical protein